jgi:hypothetical protein
MTIIIAPMVGMYFRLKEDGVPAAAIISNLPSEVPLRLQAEPDNEHDPNAIKVIIDATNVPHNEDIEVAVGCQGMTPTELYGSAHHLAYIDSTKTGCAARLAPVLDKVISSVLVFSAEGKPGVRVTLRDEETEEKVQDTVEVEDPVKV